MIMSLYWKKEGLSIEYNDDRSPGESYQFSFELEFDF